MYLIELEKLKKLNAGNKVDFSENEIVTKNNVQYCKLSLDDIRKLSYVLNVPIRTIIDYIYDKVSEEIILFQMFQNKYKDTLQKKVDVYISENILNQIKELSEQLGLPVMNTNSKQILYIVFEYYLRLKKKSKNQKQ